MNLLVAENFNQRLERPQNRARLLEQPPNLRYFRTHDDANDSDHYGDPATTVRTGLDHAYANAGESVRPVRRWTLKSLQPARHSQTAGGLLGQKAGGESSSADAIEIQ